MLFVVILLYSYGFIAEKVERKLKKSFFIASIPLLFLSLLLVFGVKIPSPSYMLEDFITNIFNLKGGI